jgi:hypothetical protein
MTIQLLLWVLLGVIIGSAIIRYPWFPPAACLSVLILVPAAESTSLLGISYSSSNGVLSLHPASWLILSATCSAIILLPLELATAIKAVPSSVVILFTFVPSAVILLSIFAHGTSGISQGAEQFVVPCFVLVLLLIANQQRPISIRSAERYLLGLALIVAALAVVQQLLDSNVPFRTAYAAYPWTQFYAATGYRSPSTVDHPLVAGLVMLSAFPVALGSNHVRVWLKLPAALLLLLGILSTGSRSAVVIVALYIVLTMAHSMLRFRVANVILLALVCLGAVFAFRTSLSNLVVDRLTSGNSTGGDGIRLLGIRSASDLIATHVLTGDGIGSSYAASARILGRSNSFENPILMMTVDVGFVVAILWHVAWLILAVHGRSPLRRTQLGASLALAVIFCLGFSSYGTKSAVSAMLAFLCVSLYLARSQPLAVPVAEVREPRAKRDCKDALIGEIPSVRTNPTPRAFDLPSAGLKRPG